MRGRRILLGLGVIGMLGIGGLVGYLAGREAESESPTDLVCMEVASVESGVRVRESVESLALRVAQMATAATTTDSDASEDALAAADALAPVVDEYADGNIRDSEENQANWDRFRDAMRRASDACGQESA